MPANHPNADRTAQALGDLDAETMIEMLRGAVGARLDQLTHVPRDLRELKRHRDAARALGDRQSEAAIQMALAGIAREATDLDAALAPRLQQ